MKNKIGRKITSLTLLSILLASGVTFAIPGTMPVAEAAHNANLFVSAENPLFSNYFGGPMVVEIVVNDPSLTDTDELKGEPDVTVNGKDVRMVQGTDGLWYAYVADRTQALAADVISPAGAGLDFGNFCPNDTFLADGDPVGSGIAFSDTVGIALPEPVTGSGAVAIPAAGSCDTAGGGAPAIITAGDLTGAGVTMNVVRESKTPSTADPTAGAEIGQIGLPNTFAWPIIQLYDFNPTGNVVVQYNKGGGTQTTTLTFDTMDTFSRISLDRTSYPTGAEVHTTITDGQLNIDPTDEDTWTFATVVGAPETYYQIFNENGATTVVSLTSADIQPFIGGLMFEDNGAVTLAGGGIVDSDANNDQTIAGGYLEGGANTLASSSIAGTGLAVGNQPMTFVESGSNTGVFANYDENDDANLDIVATAARGTSATINYNKIGTSIVVGLSFGTIDIAAPAGEWKSGEELSVSVVDSDANKNSRADEDLDVFNPNVTIIPSLRIGTPITLAQPAATLNFALFATPAASIVDTALASCDANEGTAAAAAAAGVAAPATPSVAGTCFFAAAGPPGALIDTVNGASAAPDITSIDRFSDRAILGLAGLIAIAPAAGAAADDGALLVMPLAGQTVGTLQASLINPAAVPADTGFNFINYDIRALDQPLGPALAAGTITNFDIYLIIDEDPADGILLGLAGAETMEAGALASTEYTLIPLVQDATAQQGLVQIISSQVAPIFAAATAPAIAAVDTGDAVGFVIALDTISAAPAFAFDPTQNMPIVIDLFAFGFRGDGFDTANRVNNALYRFELEESGDNTSTFVGSAEFTMLNQINIFAAGTYTGLRTIDDEVTFIVHEDLTDEDAPRVNYLDVGADGVATQIADQENADTHTAVASLDKETYKQADTVTVTVEDADLNVDSDLIDIYTVVRPTILPSPTAGDTAEDTIGVVGVGLYSDGLTSRGRVLDITFDDNRWLDGDNAAAPPACAAIDTDLGAAAVGAALGVDPVDDGLFDSGFTLVETGPATGVFRGDFQIPATYCDGPNGVIAATQGLDLEVNYVDFRDGSGELIETGDGAGIRGNTGSVSLDRTVYPVPFGNVGDYVLVAAQTTPATQSFFPVHATAVGAVLGAVGTDSLVEGDLAIHVRVNDPDFDLSATGEDLINVVSAAIPGIETAIVLAAAPTAPVAPGTVGAVAANGPVLLTISRGSSTVNLATAGGPNAVPGVITTTGAIAAPAALPTLQELGPIREIAPNTGIFELDFIVRHTDGPVDALCPITTTYDVLVNTLTPAVLGGANDRFDDAVGGVGVANHCILQGDILTVQYTDPTDASGRVNTVTDSATFDLRNGVLQSDKSVYIIGSDMILTVIEPDFDLDSDAAETYDLDIIEWDSDAATTTIGNLGGGLVFDPEPSDFRETGDSTGIFQAVIEIPGAIFGAGVDRGEEIELEYTDWGPSGADYVGDENEDINLTVYTSNFGATVELDQKVYTWTDKVFITIVAPDHNFDSNLIDSIGENAADQITVSTRGFKLTQYRLVETGTDTGIFTGEVILTGFCFNADGDTTTGRTVAGVCAVGDDPPVVTGNGAGVTRVIGPTNGFIQSDDDDGLTVSFEFTEDETVVGSALIRWNIGEVQFLEASYPATGQGVVRVVDPDMNINPESVDNFNIDAWSDSDAGGIDLTVTETNEATGIFEGTIFFTVSDQSSGHRLRVAEGDTVTAEYEDNTLPSPYTTGDELEITATAFIGSIVPPLERAPASNPRIVDAFGNELDEVNVDQQVQITADLANGQDRDQSFAYLVQIQDEDGVTVSLSWITGSLAPGQSLNPAQSWTPTSSGTYNVQIFVWESVDNPDALSPPVSTTITVV